MAARIIMSGTLGGGLFDSCISSACRTGVPQDEPLGTLQVIPGAGAEVFRKPCSMKIPAEVRPLGHPHDQSYGRRRLEVGLP